MAEQKDNNKMSDTKSTKLWCPNCEIDIECNYESRKVGSVADLNLYICGYIPPTVGKLRESYPETYALIEKLYEKKVVYVEIDDCPHNKFPLDSSVYQNKMVYYKMPEGYTELADLYKQEFLKGKILTRFMSDKDRAFIARIKSDI
jgi:hypothetical protein